MAISAGDFSRSFSSEDQYTEFKTGIGVAIRESIIAFSNADGGVIFIGVDDGGEVLGRLMDSGSIDQIHARMRELINPGRYEISGLAVGEKQVIVLSVARREEGFAQTPQGVVRVRRGSRDDALFGADLQSFINARSSARFEEALTDVESSTVTEGLRQLSRAYGWTREADQRAAEEGFTGEGRLTVAGVLCMTEDPSEVLGKAYVEVMRYRDDTTTDYDRRVEIRGPVHKQLIDTVDLLLDELGTEMVVLGVRRHELPRVPEVVLRETIANAIAHRSYELNRSAIRVEIRPGVITVTSPGGLPEPVTVSNIREVNAPRNLHVINALRRFGLAEDAGRGIDVIEDAMQQELLDPPRFADRDHEFEVVLPIGSPVTTEERAWIRELERRGDLEGQDRLVLVHAAREGAITNSSTRDLLNIDAYEARGILRRLRDGGLLEQRGVRGGVTYHLPGGLRPPAALRLDSDQLADLVERLADDSSITNASVRSATGLDRAAALSILDRLVNEGRLVRTGERRGTRYERPRRESASGLDHR